MLPWPESFPARSTSRGRVALRRGRLAGGEADLALGLRHARERVDEEEDALSLRPEVLGDGGGDHRRPHALQGRLVAGGDHHHRAGEAVSEVALDEVAHLAAALADEPHHHHVGVGRAGQHAEEHALAHPRSGQDGEPLPLADGEAGVDGADAESDGPGHAPPLHRRRRRGVQAGATAQDEARPTVHGAERRVHHAAEESLADADAVGGGARHDRAALADAVDV